MKILILKPSSLGDVVQALPVLRLLKQHLPQSSIYWWIDADLSPLLEEDPDLSGLCLFHRRRWASPRYWPEVLDHVSRLRAMEFDWIIDLQALARSAFLAWLACGSLTVGLDDLREGAPAFFDLRVPRDPKRLHAVDWYLDVLQLLGVPVHWDFKWLPPRPGVARAIRQRWQAGEGVWVALHPGARWLNKRWPISHYARLAQRLLAEHTQARLIVLGASGDRDLGQAIKSAAPDRCLDLTGQTSLPELIEWLRLCRVLVTNDTGPMHLAAALGTPVVALFGPTDPRRTGPYGALDSVLRFPLPCNPCLRSTCHYREPMKCLQAIPPEQVQAAAGQWLRE